MVNFFGNLSKFTAFIEYNLSISLLSRQKELFSHFFHHLGLQKFVCGIVTTALYDLIN